MTKAHERKKQPELVRRRLLDCGGQLAAESGLGSVTIQAVSDAAGVTKGGMLHHFPDKRQFLEALFDDMLAELDKDIDALMALNPDAPGAFTQAYAELSLHEAVNENQKKAAQTFVMLGDADLRKRWDAWISARHKQHALTDSEPIYQVIRFAADGVWMSGLTKPLSLTECEQLRALFNDLLKRKPNP